MVSFISISRISVIAGHTFTQLVRMKVFYLLVIFAAILLGLQFVDMSALGAVHAVEQNIRVMKGGGFFAMNMFSIVLALSATALLLPKDVEDRTLYTILCKPVPRLDYLIGKLGGVLSLVAVSLLVMNGLFCGILYFRVESMIAEHTQMLEMMGKGPEVIEAYGAEVRAQVSFLDLQIGVLAVYLKAMVVAAVALLVSTFSTSTIFTIIISLVVVLIGLVQGEARDYFLAQQALGQESLISECARWVTLLFPDFKVLGMEDGVIANEFIDGGIVGRVTLIATLYTSIYIVLSWFIFRRKEL